MIFWPCYREIRTISVMTTMAKTANPRELVTSNIRFSFFISSISDSLTFLTPIVFVSIVIYAPPMENVSMGAQ